MELIATSVVAVLGTLLGAAFTHAFQRRAVKEANDLARGEKLRQERVEAYSSFGGALANYRRSQLDRWYTTHRDAADPDLDQLQREARRRRDAALEALFRVQLLTDAPEVVTAGFEAFDAMDLFARARSREEVEKARDTTRALMHTFVQVAKQQLEPGTPAPRPR
ncbi:hypothetical protein L1785_21085 [Antribacter sp. KLBMP9083]|uniref:Protein kilB n=1 Tax=Antribacter soli TaxID=2910976 RepID=A0AA41QA65_9MICO|nr:hypothetical protein [Antribacter soli]MCF4119703.1 hypothetical protein [Antribacter soli]MCF4123465.1 hypothetical protein [Antribacter soli]